MKLIYMFIVVASLFSLYKLTSATPHNLVDVKQVNPSLQLDIRYATPDNFTKQPVYTSARCYLRSSTALKLDKVQKELQELGLSLKIFDGYRPLSVQKIFWQLVPDERYVGNPAKGSKHNRGSAVDVTVVEQATNKELEMPSGFDDFSSKAHRQYSTMSSQAARNCKLLEVIMVKHGFEPLSTEWWHFDDVDWQSYEILDIPFEQLEASQKADKDLSPETTL